MSIVKSNKKNNKPLDPDYFKKYYESHKDKINTVRNERRRELTALEKPTKLQEKAKLLADDINHNGIEGHDRRTIHKYNIVYDNNKKKYIVEK